MSRKFSLILLLLFVGFSNSLSQTYNLKIEIENIKKDGIIYMAVYNNSEDFNYINNGENKKKDRWVFNLIEDISVNGFNKDIILEKGVYAISLFVDTNGNKKLDTNFVGIPNEQYGFSNNAMGLLGKPSFKNASFKLTQESKIKIILK